MPNDLNLSWSSHAKTNKFKPKKLRAPRSNGLPMKLPPKQNLGRVFRMINQNQKAVLVGAFLMAVLSPITALWLQNTQTHTATQAAYTLPTIRHLVLVDATTGKDFMILDQPEVVLRLSDLPERIDIRPEIDGNTSQVIYQTSLEMSLARTTPPYSLSGNTGWVPVSGNEIFRIKAFGIGANANHSGATYELELRVIE